MLGNTDEEYEIEHLQTSTGIVFELEKDTELPNGDKVNVIRITKGKDSNSYIVTVQRGLPPFHIVVYNPAYVFFDVSVTLD
ncbi:hypothetical protein [Sporomusa sphaeroides]|uniref:Uncharacterized protein n=1 Tax=Sporomusa sphaeroides DSM 2875 TaxID=1337886 RepID=A0A1U7M9V9_9FIRM|nr:hypothetical protein [Sporomusa sphaeroides]OLS54340.1 hypothetical protein SPSPH_45860 [Sporomusa sphaeroides DSM 2875]CVK21569.1 hypothetical protein SSPH_04261 [Sporomusa sphaeroides DSM 2875]